MNNSSRHVERMRAIQQQIVQGLSDEALERLAHGDDGTFAWLATLSDEALERIASRRTCTGSTAPARPGRPRPAQPAF